MSTPSNSPKSPSAILAAPQSAPQPTQAAQNTTPSAVQSNSGSKETLASTERGVGAPGESAVRVGAPALQEVKTPSTDAKVEANQAPEPITLPELTDAQISKLIEGRKFKVKIDGVEQEVGLNDLTSDYQLKTVSHKRLQEAAEARKKVEGIIEMVKADPIKALKDPALSLDLRKLAEDIIQEEIERETMTPEQRELADLKREKASREAEVERAKAEAAEKEAAAKDEAEFQFYLNGTQTALKAAGLPINNHNIRRMASIIEDLQYKGVKDWSFDSAAADLKADHISAQKELISTLPADRLVELLGEDLIKKVREYDASRIKKVAPTPALKDQGEAPAEPKRKETWAERWKRIDGGR